MLRRSLILLTLGVLAAGFAAPAAQAQEPNRYYYYPYYYFPHNYWPNQERWPDPKIPFQRAPRWMAHPPYHDPMFRYELQRPMRYHKGHHFWLDQF